MQKINDLSRIQEARLDADSLNMPPPHILPANPSLFTNETYYFSLMHVCFHFGSGAGLSYCIFARVKKKNSSSKRKV